MKKRTNIANTVLIARVHNHDPKRVASQKKVADAISDFFTSSGAQVLEMASSYQPPLVTGRTRAQMLLSVIPNYWAQQLFEVRESRRRRGKPETITLRKRWRILKRALRLAVSSDELERAFERRQIEGRLSNKHFHAWLGLLSSSADFAIVLEDDVVLKSSQSPQEIGSLAAIYAGRADYVDLAGGYTRNELGLEGDPAKDIVLKFMLANTTCAYMISRRAAEAVVTLVFDEPKTIYMSPDFLLGLLSERGFEGVTVLPANLPLIHGSRSGKMASLIPY